MTRTSLADELAETRAEILRLRRHEAALRQALIAATTAQRRGRWHEAEVSLHRRLVFNHWLLPDAVRQDPRYWQERSAHLVTLHPAQALPKPRPGWPIRRGPAGLALH